MLAAAALGLLILFLAAIISLFMKFPILGTVVILALLVLVVFIDPIIQHRKTNRKKK